ncbi:hypothetical protein F2P81_024804 [Scophthalmus maximus]|uniref:Uncharacterized protein n=1 Tax=Scophthalmus maximus TaxID=52904 RepID=A0A6A4RLU8_SCOMX|nr:hypothetical protein F2P81_024804 [Scophthalmus maximus]
MRGEQSSGGERLLHSSEPNGRSPERAARKDQSTELFDRHVFFLTTERLGGKLLHRKTMRRNKRSYSLEWIGLIAANPPSALREFSDSPKQKSRCLDAT